MDICIYIYICRPVSVKRTTSFGVSLFPSTLQKTQHTATTTATTNNNNKHNNDNNMLITVVIVIVIVLVILILMREAW